MKYKKTVKPTNYQMKNIKCYWEVLQEIEEDFCFRISSLEKSMEIKTGIKGIEFFRNDFGEYCGVGNVDRTMKLIHRKELE